MRVEIAQVSTLYSKGEKMKKCLYHIIKLVKLLDACMLFVSRLCVVRPSFFIRFR